MWDTRGSYICDVWTSPLKAHITEDTNHRQPCIVPYSIVRRSVNKSIFFNTALVHSLPHSKYYIYTHVNIICATHQVRWNLSTFSHLVILTQFLILSSHLCVGFPIIVFIQIIWLKHGRNGLWSMRSTVTAHPLHLDSVTLIICLNGAHCESSFTCIFFLLLRCFIHFLV
jgi:hypothetical protein